ncbi:MAG: ribosome small subunit-dependent GTPase A [Halieaceae bacterium]|jgi:ribosome biogenesis GTPase / thiamine phosphate phosphatase|nr:ribosome small subunit-dependent GTPase A [Halieaceae bacterium]
MGNYNTLACLGWQPFFQQQLSLEEWNDLSPARVVEQHRTSIAVVTQSGSLDIALQHSMPEMVVGDWVLLDSSNHFIRLLDRKTCFKRKAAGSKVNWQLISANVDTAFIVVSMNDDFNLSRIERYLSLVHDSGAEPVVVLSKFDLSGSPEQFISQVQGLDGLLFVEAVNCLDLNSVEKLNHWIKEGSTSAVLGSSGVGKSTLINTLLSEPKQGTASIREDDAKGRHTTTRRSLIALKSGGLILDTPGMREIQLADCKSGISTTFPEIEALAKNCRFSDCRHGSEPGCAVLSALNSGQIEQRRLDNYTKLLKEEAINSASLSQKRASDKALGKFYKRTLSESHRFKGR